MTRRRLIAAGLAVVGTVLLATSVSIHRIGGVSNEPNYLIGDLVVVNRVAYDVKLPPTDLILWRRSGPERGDVVLARSTARPGVDVVRRVAGVPGDEVELRESRLRVNGADLGYTSAAEADRIGTEIGEVVEWEIGLGGRHSITYTPGACAVASYGPVLLADGEYFLLGDSRDRCVDSRRLGPARRDAILGEVSPPLLARRVEAAPSPIGPDAE